MCAKPEGDSPVDLSPTFSILRAEELEYAVDAEGLLYDIKLGVVSKAEQNRNEVCDEDAENILIDWQKMTIAHSQARFIFNGQDLFNPTVFDVNYPYGYGNIGIRIREVDSVLEDEQKLDLIFKSFDEWPNEYATSNIELLKGQIRQRGPSAVGGQSSTGRQSREVAKLADTAEFKSTTPDLSAYTSGIGGKRTRQATMFMNPNPAESASNVEPEVEEITKPSSSSKKKRTKQEDDDEEDDDKEDDMDEEEEDDDGKSKKKKRKTAKRGRPTKAASTKKAASPSVTFTFMKPFTCILEITLELTLELVCFLEKAGINSSLCIS
jgi:hypothetical protein